MVKIRKYIVICLLICLFKFPETAAQDFPSLQRIKKHIDFLGSDIFEGRGTGQLGGNLAAKYLALQFDEYNLQTLTNDNTYYQQIPMQSSKVLPQSEFKIYYPGSYSSLNLWEHYVLINQGEQTFTPVPVKCVFAGFGINAPEYDYNDYAEINAAGKIVVVLDGEPHSDDPSFFESEKSTLYSVPESKIRMALANGAYGVIILPFSDNNQKFWQQLNKAYSFNDIKLAYSPSSKFGAFIDYETAELLFEGSGFTLSRIKELAHSNKLVSFPLNVSVSFKGRFEQKEFFSPNIVGMIRGNDPVLKDEYVIISAHYDHLGVGPTVDGDSIYNGVFDNSAGCSALLEIARYFSLHRNTLKRSVIIILTTGEEKGLLGSKYYTNNPLVPLHKTIANINIDGIASFDEFKSVIATGSELSELGDQLKNYCIRNGLDLKKQPENIFNLDSFFYSDQYEFARAGIPSILISDGFDYKNISGEEGINLAINYFRNYYHTPFDDLSLKINWNAFLQHTSLLAGFCKEVINSEIKPEWKPGVPYLNTRLKTINEKK